MRALAAIAVLVLIGLGPVQADEKFIVNTSAHSVTDTLNRLTDVLTERGITVFARIDHAAGAIAVGDKLSPSQLLIFGSPKIGTPLMKSNIRIGLDLPLKALAYEERGTVYLLYTNPEALKARYAISDRDKVFAAMAGALDKLTTAATSSK